MLCRRLVAPLLLLHVCLAHTNGTEEQTKGKDEHPHKFGEKDEIHDVEHIQQHLKDKVDVSKMTEEQQHFYYFSMHDLNKDNLLDGLELEKAIFHGHEEARLPPMQDEEIEKLVDTVLNDMDMNGDGLIDFAEYHYKTKH